MGWNPNNNGSFNGVNNYGQQYPNMQKKMNSTKMVLFDAINKGIEFIKRPKKFIEEYLAGNNNSLKYVYAFIGLDVFLALVYCFLLKFKISSAIQSLANSMLGGNDYFSLKAKFDQLSGDISNKVLFTSLIYIMLIIAVVWIYRFIFSKLLSSNGNDKKIFSLTAIVSIIDCISFIVNILFVLLLNVKKLVDMNTYEQLGSTISHFSMYNASNYVSQVIKACNQVFGGIMYLCIIFVIVNGLLYIYSCISMCRVADGLKLDDKNEKKARVLIILFVLLIFVINNYYGTFVFIKNTKAIVEYAMTTGSNLISNIF